MEEETIDEAIENLKELKDSEEIQEFYYSDMFIKSLDIAIQALEKQLPKEPRLIFKADLANTYACECGYKTCVPNKGTKARYCKMCGQRFGL